MSTRSGAKKNCLREEERFIGKEMDRQKTKVCGRLATAVSEFVLHAAVVLTANRCLHAGISNTIGASMPKKKNQTSTVGSGVKLLKPKARHIGMHRRNTLQKEEFSKEENTENQGPGQSRCSAGNVVDAATTLITAPSKSITSPVEEGGTGRLLDGSSTDNSSQEQTHSGGPNTNCSAPTATLSKLSKPVRLQLKRTKGFKLVSPSGRPVVKVDRTTKWGNPFVPLKMPDGRYGIDRKSMSGVFRDTYEEAVDLCIAMFSANAVLMDVSELRGKDLACWCREGSACHADVLLELANKE